ncbi:family 16 glycosylhydrolase [Methylobacterium sp. A54F]
MVAHRRPCLRTALLPLALLAAVAPRPAAAEGEPKAPPPGGASFVDRFDHLDHQRWFVADGWANGPIQACTWSPRNIAIGSAGGLTLSLSPIPYKDRKFSCAEIQSTAFYGYGTYEVRMRPAAGSGVVSTFFTFTGPPNGTPQDEIDFEFLGKEPGKVQLNYFASGQGGHETLIDLGGDASKKTVDYALQWFPDRVRWYVNGKLVHEVTRAADAPFPERPGRIIISIWNGTDLVADWVGPSAALDKPLTATYERIAFTRMGEPCAFPDSLACRAPSN